ncbi:MAG: LpqB family beta-propeller domain-containing protein [Actinomycetota bacterium]|nr:LpqB family beta-propeller domain-containing protein [Actinomycetota bacterium]
MSKVDDELTRRLRQAERPVDGDDLFEGLERRRSHRERVRRVQAGMLAFAVLAATAGGFVALREVFGETPRDVGKPPVLAENGEIVFSSEGKDGYAHLYAMQPDGSGRRQITNFGTNDTDPAVSPDGRTIAFVHQLEDVDPALATIPIEGGTVTWLSDPGIGVRDPAWSPDGSTIAFVGTAADRQRIMAFNMASGEVSPIVGDRVEEFANPAWSPDGEWIVFSSRASGTSDPWSLWTVTPEGTQRRQAGWMSPERNAAAFSPDGTRIAALLVQSDPEEPDEIWTMTSDPEADGLVTGAPLALLTSSFGISLQPDIDWSPDGSTLLVSDGRWIYRVEPGPQGDPRQNLIRVGEGSSPAWQPVPVGSEPKPSPTSEPTVSPNPEPAGRDIGLGFNVCHDERLGGIDFLGNGRSGTAWIGVPPKEDGTCPRFAKPGKYLVAVDHIGDRNADSWVDLPWVCYNGCGLADATDLDANGSEELIVRGFFSIMDYYVLTVRPDTSGEMVVSPILVAEPGHAPANLTPGEPLRIDAGGDAGYGSHIQCEGFPRDPVIVWTWTSTTIEGNEPTEVHITRLQLQSDGLFHVIGTNDYTVPHGAPTGLGYETAPACGVDWHPDA